MAETAQQAAIRGHYENTRGWRLYRNNVGVLPDRRGVPVRFGLANDSEQVNRVVKSGDLIGWEPVLITPAMVGEVIARFTSIEVKKLGWSPAGSGDRFDHEQAQRNWVDLVRSDGGTAGFMRDFKEGFLRT